MKLRLRGSALRMRITPTELAGLARGEVVGERVEFGPAGTPALRYELAGDGAASEVVATYCDHTIRVVLPSAVVARLATTDEIGVEATQATSSGHTLTVLVEKDFRCLVPRDGEDNDGFTRPDDAPSC